MNRQPTTSTRCHHAVVPCPWSSSILKLVVEKGKSSRSPFTPSGIRPASGGHNIATFGSLPSYEYLRETYRLVYIQSDSKLAWPCFVLSSHWSHSDFIIFRLFKLLFRALWFHVQSQLSCVTLRLWSHSRIDLTHRCDWLWLIRPLYDSILYTSCAVATSLRLKRST